VLAQMAFCLVPEVFNAIDAVMAIRKKLAVVDAQVFKFGDVEDVVAAKAIRINNAVWPYFLAYNRHQRLGLGIMT